MLEELNKIALEFKEGFLDILPKLITALIVLIIGYFLAYLVRYLIKRLLYSLDRVISPQIRNIEFKESTNFIGQAFFWLIILSTLLFIANILDLTIITAGIQGVIKYTPNILAGIMILLAANMLGKLASGVISTASSRFGFVSGNTLGRIVRLLIMLTAIIIVTDQIGIEVTFLINMLSITLGAILFGAALVFGLGAKSSFSNIIAAYYIRKLYKEGDLIKIGDIEGVLSKIESTVVLVDTEIGRFAIPTQEFIESKSLLIKKNN